VWVTCGLPAVSEVSLPVCRLSCLSISASAPSPSPSLVSISRPRKGTEREKERGGLSFLTFRFHAASSRRTRAIFQPRARGVCPFRESRTRQSCDLITLTSLFIAWMNARRAKRRRERERGIFSAADGIAAGSNNGSNKLQKANGRAKREVGRSSSKDGCERGKGKSKPPGGCDEPRRKWRVRDGSRGAVSFSSSGSVYIYIY